MKAALLALTVSAAPALAQPAQDTSAQAFEAETRAAVPDAGDDYGLIRCGGLFRALSTAIGPEVLGPERMASFQEAERRFGVAAAMIRAEATGAQDVEPLFPAILTDIEALAPHYLARFNANRETRGHSWQGDAMLKDDQTFCTSLLASMEE